MKDRKELLDLVDINDKVIGTIDRNECEKPGVNIRVVVANLINEHNEVLLGLKHKRKDSNLWTIVGSGHVAKGEKPIEAASRELIEESRITADQVNLEFQEKYFIQRYTNGGFVYNYINSIKSSEYRFPRENEEFCKYMWQKLMPIEEIRNISVTDTVKESFNRIGKHYYYVD